MNFDTPGLDDRNYFWISISHFACGQLIIRTVLQDVVFLGSTDISVQQNEDVCNILELTKTNVDNGGD